MGKEHHDFSSSQGRKNEILSVGKACKARKSFRPLFRACRLAFTSILELQEEMGYRASLERSGKTLESSYPRKGIFTFVTGPMSLTSKSGTSRSGVAVTVCPIIQ